MKKIIELNQKEFFVVCGGTLPNLKPHTSSAPCYNPAQQPQLDSPVVQQQVTVVLHPAPVIPPPQPQPLPTMDLQAWRMNAQTLPIYRPVS